MLRSFDKNVLDAQLELRAQEFAKKNPDFETTVRELFSIFPAARHFQDAVLNLRLLRKFSMSLPRTREAIERVNAMSPRELTRFIGVLEGQIQAHGHRRRCLLLSDGSQTLQRP